VENWDFPYGPKVFFSTGQCVFSETFPQRLWKRNFVETFPQFRFPHSTAPVEKIERKKREEDEVQAKQSTSNAPAMVTGHQAQRTTRPRAPLKFFLLLFLSRKRS